MKPTSNKRRVLPTIKIRILCLYVTAFWRDKPWWVKLQSKVSVITNDNNVCWLVTLSTPKKKEKKLLMVIHWSCVLGACPHQLCSKEYLKWIPISSLGPHWCSLSCFFYIFMLGGVAMKVMLVSFLCINYYCEDVWRSFLSMMAKDSTSILHQIVYYLKSVGVTISELWELIPYKYNITSLLTTKVFFSIVF